MKIQVGFVVGWAACCFDMPCSVQAFMGYWCLYMRALPPIEFRGSGVPLIFVYCHSHTGQTE